MAIETAQEADEKAAQAKNVAPSDIAEECIVENLETLIEVAEEEKDKE